MRVSKPKYEQMKMDIFDNAAEAFKPQSKRPQVKKQIVEQDDRLVGWKVANREFGRENADRITHEDLSYLGSHWGANGAIPKPNYREALDELRSKYGIR